MDVGCGFEGLAVKVGAEAAALVKVAVGAGVKVYVWQATAGIAKAGE